MSAPSISRAEWLKALEAAQADGRKSDPDLLTLHDYAEMVGVSLGTARTHLRLLIKKGMAAQAMKMAQRADGRWQNVPAYRLKKKAP